MRIAYLTGRYPAISHTFISREVRALRSLGVLVDTFSIWPTDSSLLLSDDDCKDFETTKALLSTGPLRAVAAGLRALLTRPGRLAAITVEALRLRRPGLRGIGLSLTWVLEAVVLWDICRAQHIAHVHAHLNGTAPVVALLVSKLGDETHTGGPRWTWSMTVHGPAEFYEVHEERLADKVRAATFVVCISDFARSQLMGMVEERHWPKLRVVHCGVDLDAFSPTHPSPPRNRRTIEILTVGRLTSVKGQACLVEALELILKRSVQARLTIVGEGPARDEIEGVAQRLGIESHVEMAGAVGQDDIQDLYERADVFALASFAEGVPIVLMEAMAKEIPVIAPAIMGIPELIEHEVSGLLTKPARPDQIANCVKRLAADPELSARLGSQGRRAVSEGFDVRRSAEQLREIFAEFMEASPG